MVGVCNINNNNIIYSSIKHKKSVTTLQWVKVGEGDSIQYYRI